MIGLVFQPFGPVDHVIDLFLDQTFDQVRQIAVQPFAQDRLQHFTDNAFSVSSLASE